jgi:hypothetical protein
MMKLRNSATGLVAVAFVLTTGFAADAAAQQVECSGPVRNVTAVTNPAGHLISARYQSTDPNEPNLQLLLSTTIQTPEEGCVIAHLSGQVRITDNYVAFQVRVDGVPMEGQVPLPLFSTPVVFVAIDAASNVNEDEQYIDPTKAVAYNFFTRVPRGSHTVEVLGAAGSAVNLRNRPSATHLVLTLEHR